MSDPAMTLAGIDVAIGCQQCGGPLDDSPSSDFCNDDCQADWHAARTQPLDGYREPWLRPADFPGVGTESSSTCGDELDRPFGGAFEEVVAAMRPIRAAAEQFARAFANPSGDLAATPCEANCSFRPGMSSCPRCGTSYDTLLDALERRGAESVSVERDYEDIGLAGIPAVVTVPTSAEVVVEFAGDGHLRGLRFDERLVEGMPVVGSEAIGRAVARALRFRLAGEDG